MGGAAVPHQAGQTEITERRRWHKQKLCRGAVHRSHDGESVGVLLARQSSSKQVQERIKNDAADPPRSTGKRPCHARAPIHRVVHILLIS